MRRDPMLFTVGLVLLGIAILVLFGAARLATGSVEGAGLLTAGVVVTTLIVGHERRA